MTLYRFTRGLRLSRLGSTAAVWVVLGQIIAVPTPTPAQSPPEQLPSASEKTKDADLGTGKEPVANTISTSHHVGSTKDKAEATDTDRANPWGPVPTEKASLANLAPVLLPYFNNGPVDPSLRQLFKIDMKEQSKKFVAMLDTIVESIDDWERISPVLRELGRRHVAYGVKGQHYEVLCSALIWAFGQALQPGFDNEVRAAWTAVIRDVNTQMKIGAAAVPSS